MSTMTPKTAAVIPCYRAAAHVAQVIAAMPSDIEHIIVIDDACPQKSGDVAESLGDSRVVVVRHPVNKGVGGAVVSGYRKALEMNCDIAVKIDGDGQMDPRLAHKFMAPLISGEADYTKGNRFTDFKALSSMPRVRLFGNSVLSFLIKAASGYWSMMDPTNGYTAIHRRALEELDLEKLEERYFFESDLLIRLGEVRAVVRGIPMSAKYGEETSSLSIAQTALEFPPKILNGLLRRMFLRYFVYDFNMVSIYLVLGLPLTVFGLVYGGIEWLDSVSSGAPKATGVIMLAALPLIVGFQMLLQAIAIDIASEPKR
ncbi:MAG: glycosyl transferase family 2 [Alphaproteobacteria bacterium RIFOXYD12_FULL_60_8]|nr:MAG: glycosyl transferase family 2 [Alphaproteobacteria bacterium RIFOXYD12_FULL_60_8]